MLKSSLWISAFSLLMMCENNAFAVGLTLDQAITEGMGHSPRIEIAKSSAEEARWKKTEAFSTYLPTLSFSGTDITNQNYMYTDIAMAPFGSLSIPNIVPSWNYTLSAQISIFDGFAGTQNYNSAKSMQVAAENDAEWAQFKTEKEITLQFYRTLGSKILKDVAEQNLKTLEDHLHDVRLFKRAGISTNYDLLRVEVQVSEAQSEVMNVNDNMEIAKRKLAEILGEDSETRDLSGTFPLLKSERIHAVGESAYEARKDLLSLQSKTEGLQHLEAASSRYMVPRISLFGNYIYYNNRNTNFPDSTAFRDAYQVGVNLTWNLFDGMVSIARSKESIERRYQAEKSLRLAKLSAISDLDMWKRKYLYYCSVYRARLSDVEKATESVRLAKEGRKVGARTNTDLLDAEGELFRAKAGVVNSQVGAVEALINLELTTGQRLLK